MHDRDPHPVRMAAFPLGPWDYFRRDVQRIRNHSPAWLCWAFPRRCCRCAAGSPRSFASRKAKEKNPRLITFSCNCNVLHQIFSKFHPKYTKKLHWGNQTLADIYCWFAADNYPWRLCCVAIPLSLFNAASQRTPVVIRKLPPTPLRSRWKGTVQTCYHLNIKMSTSPSTSCFMLFLNIRKCWRCRLNPLTSF